MGVILNFTIFTRTKYHALRAIALAVFPPAFLLLFIQGILSGDVNPAIGILPLFFSATYSALLLANEKKCGCQASGLTGTPVHLVVDMCLGIALLVCLILDWVFMSWQYDRGLVILGTYGTNFLICNFLIHVYFVARQLSDAMGLSSMYPLSCPQCRNDSFSFGVLKLSFGGEESGYAPLLDQEGQPRSSVEAVVAQEDGAMV